MMLPVPQINSAALVLSPVRDVMCGPQGPWVPGGPASAHNRRPTCLPGWSGNVIRTCGPCAAITARASITHASSCPFRRVAQPPARAVLPIFKAACSYLGKPAVAATARPLAVPETSDMEDRHEYPTAVRRRA